MQSTIKLMLKEPAKVETHLRLYNAVKRFSFNRFQEGMTEKQIKVELAGIYALKKTPKERKSLKEVSWMLSGSQTVWINSWIVQCAIKDAEALFERFGQKKIVFGGKANKKRYDAEKITKEEYRAKRIYQPILIQGEKRCNGNRLFDFEFMNGRLWFKPSRDERFELEFHMPHRNEMEALEKLQELADKGEVTISVTMSRGFVCIGFEETLIKEQKFEAPIKGRVLAIDQNPESLGLAVLDFNKDESKRSENPEVLYKEVVNYSVLTAKTGKASDSKESKYQFNKLKTEVLACAHHIDELVKHWRCEKVVVEDLSFKPKRDKGGNKIKGNRETNRKNKNLWMRRLFTRKVRSLSELHGYALVEVNPCYSSFVGNLVYGAPTTPDMVAAAIEIGRRGHTKYKKGCFYPGIDNALLAEPWKQMLAESGSWKALFHEVEKAKLKYRFKLDDSVMHAVTSKFHKQEKVFRYTFA